MEKTQREQDLEKALLEIWELVRQMCGVVAANSPVRQLAAQARRIKDDVLNE